MTSPSVISLMRAPASRTSLIRSSCRGPVEDDHRDVVHAASEGRRDPVQVLGRRETNVHLAGHDRPHGELLEIGVGRVQEPALLGCRQHRDRIGGSRRHEVGAFKRIDRDVDLGRLAAVRVPPAQLLADVQHRRLVPLALTDDDRRGDVELVHRLAHRLRRGAVGLVTVAPAHVPRARDGGRFGHADHLQREELLHRVARGGLVAHGDGQLRLGRTNDAGDDDPASIAP